MNWSLFDFVFMGGLLGCIGLAARFIWWRSTNLSSMVASSLVVLAIFLLIWVNGAVGIIGSEDNPANLMFGGVILIVISGALFTRFRPIGMALTCLTVAAAHVVIALTALVSQSGSGSEIWPMDVLGASLFFILIWIAAAGLFWKSGASISINPAG